MINFINRVTANTHLPMMRLPPHSIAVAQEFRRSGGLVPGSYTECISSTKELLKTSIAVNWNTSLEVPLCEAGRQFAKGMFESTRVLIEQRVVHSALNNGDSWHLDTCTWWHYYLIRITSTTIISSILEWNLLISTGDLVAAGIWIL